MMIEAIGSPAMLEQLAEEVAERICQFVYDLRNEIRKNEQERSNA